MELSDFKRSGPCLTVAALMAGMAGLLDGWLMVGACILLVGFGGLGIVLYLRDLVDSQHRRFRDHAKVFWDGLKDAYDDHVGVPQPRGTLNRLLEAGDTVALRQAVEKCVYPRKGPAGLRNAAAFHDAHSSMMDILGRWAHRRFKNPYFRRTLADNFREWHESTLVALEIVVEAYAGREGVQLDRTAIDGVRDLWWNEEAKRLMNNHNI